MKQQNFHILNPRLDVNFKAIFTQPSELSRKALRSFLTAATGRIVRKVHVKENEPSKQFYGQRGIEYDINCEFDDGTLAQIEMQGYDRDYDYGCRAEYYASRLLSSTIEISKKWNDLPQIYQISVLNFIYDKDNDNPVHHYKMTDTKDNSTLSETMNIIFLELPKVKDLTDEKDISSLPDIIKWCNFFKEADNPEKQDFFNRIESYGDGIMAAKKTLSRLSDEQWRWIIQGQIEGRERDIRTHYYNAEKRGLENGMKKGLEQGMQQGLQQGSTNTKLHNALNALKMGLTPEQAAQITELPLEKVLELQKQL